MFNITIIGLYAPTEDSTDNEKDAFYDKLQGVVDQTQKHDIIIITGGLNAKVGKEIQAYAPAIGKERLRNESNDNGNRLASFALTNNLIIGGTIFPHKAIHKRTWKSPDDRTLNQIDHILINRKHRGALQDVRNFQRSRL